MNSETIRVRVPKSMLTSPNCITVPAGNDYTRGRHSFRCGDLLVVDLDAVPKHDDFVIVIRGDGSVFGRICHIEPLAGVPREEMCMGTLDADGETIHPIALGKDGRKFGVVVGALPPIDVAAHPQVACYTYGIWDVDEVRLHIPGRPESEIVFGVQQVAQSEFLLSLLRPDRRASFLAYASTIHATA